MVTVDSNKVIKMTFFDRMMANVDEEEILFDCLKDAGVIARLSPECNRCLNRDMVWHVAQHMNWSCFW